jgi:hypothetical protein
MCIRDIIESHQHTKKTLPAFANKFKELFESTGAIVAKVVSIREQILQRLLGIKEEHLNAHAVHWITIKKPGITIKIEVNIEGREAYASGILPIIEDLNRVPFFGIRDYWEDIS